MESFTKISGVTAALPLINIDTDMIIPKQFLKTIKRTGLGANLFDEMRFNEDGSVKDDFILNKAPYEKTVILVAGDNFGCGSSREHAPWAILDFGIRCVIAPSFADIFYNNCFKNGILPVRLAKDQVEHLLQVAESGEGVEFSVDLEAQQVTDSNGDVYAFDVDPFRKECLINGLDDISLTLEKSDAIDSFEQKDKENRPWLYA